MAYLRITPLPKFSVLSEKDTEEMLLVGMDVLLPEVKKNLKRVIKGVSEANFPEAEKAKLAEHIGTKFTTYKKKKCIDLYFKGKIKRTNKSGFTRVSKKPAKKQEKKGEVRRDLVSSVLEYGKTGQPPTHFLRDSLNAKEKEIERVIGEKFAEIVERNNNNN